MAGEFLVTVGSLVDLPKALKGGFLKGAREPRIAMVGRSNVGKSSLINALLGGKLARVSKQPGKTRCIHFYRWIEGNKILADLPGYGYARAAQTERERWREFIEAYLSQDPSLRRVLILLDARHGPTDLDREAIEFFRSEGIAMSFVFTKSDTLKTQAERSRRQKEAAAALQELGYDFEKDIYWVSSETKQGLPQLIEAIRKQEG